LYLFAAEFAVGTLVSVKRDQFDVGDMVVAVPAVSEQESVENVLGM